MSNISPFEMFLFSPQYLGIISNANTYRNEPFWHENFKISNRLVFDMHVGNNIKAKFHHNDPP